MPGHGEEHLAAARRSVARLRVHAARSSTAGPGGPAVPEQRGEPGGHAGQGRDEREGPPPGRAAAAAAATRPSASTSSAATRGRRRTMRPAAAASAVTTRPMDSRRTSLSLVPNRETAKSLSQPGVRSMTVPPTARSGLEAGSRTCATRSATARVRAPATTPASASTRRRPLRWGAPGGVSAACSFRRPASSSSRPGFGASPAADWIRTGDLRHSCRQVTCTSTVSHPVAPSGMTSALSLVCVRPGPVGRPHRQRVLAGRRVPGEDPLPPGVDARLGAPAGVGARDRRRPAPGRASIPRCCAHATPATATRPGRARRARRAARRCATRVLIGPLARPAARRPVGRRRGRTGSPRGR